MIQLQVIPAPKELTTKIVETLTQEYKTTGKSVWKQTYIERDLLKKSFTKCCYCECKLNEESKYLEIEHFFPKSLFPDSVVVWDNLLPSCKHCNGQKGDHDTQLEPIIHPVRNNPKAHLLLKAYRFYGKTTSTIGKKTIDVVDLNDRERLVNKRYEVGTKMLEQLENLLEELQEFEKQVVANATRKKKLRRKLTNLMKECLPQTEYSATTATTLLQSIEYPQIKRLFQTLRWWDSEFQNTENQISNIAFDSA